MQRDDTSFNTMSEHDHLIVPCFSRAICIDNPLKKRMKINIFPTSRVYM